MPNRYEAFAYTVLGIALVLNILSLLGRVSSDTAFLSFQVAVIIVALLVVWVNAVLPKNGGVRGT